jgi:hypothetical protein
VGAGAEADEVVNEQFREGLPPVAETEFDRILPPQGTRTVVTE